MKKISLKCTLVLFLFLASLAGIFCAPFLTGTNGKDSFAAGGGSFATTEEEGFWSKTEEGELPYALYTHTQIEGVENPYTTYDVSNGKIPDIIMSSKADAAGGNDQLNKTTLHFAFNTPEAKASGDPTINTETTTSALLVDAKLYGTDEFSLVVDRSYDTNDVSFEFEVNLLESADANSRVPEYTTNGSDRNQLSIPSDRTGRYTFTISYNYTTSEGWTSENCTFTLTFRVVDYYTYVSGTSGESLGIENADTLSENAEFGDDFATNHIFNYNYANKPVLSFDATKFGLYFDYKTGFNTYTFSYQNTSEFESFKPLISYQDEANRLLPSGTITGRISLKLLNSEKIFNMNTYYVRADDSATDNVEEDIFYYAKFNLEEFEQFLIEEDINNSCLGDYSFGLYFLIGTKSATGSVTYEILDTTANEELLPDDIQQQTLTIFGFRMDYLDQDTKSDTYHRYTELKNDVTHSGVYAENIVTKERTINAGDGRLSNVPSLIAITNQSPIRFERYGTLTNGATTGIAKFIARSYRNEADEAQALTDIANHINGITELDFNQDYEADSSITSDGIYLMEVVYYVTIKGKTVEGKQYFVFEINNTLQDLLIQGVSDDGNTVYDIDTYTNKSLRVSLRTRPNTFFAPVVVSYRYYQNFNKNTTPVGGILQLKTTGDTPDEFMVNTYPYNYYVTNNDNTYTFSKNSSGYYYIYLRDTKNNITTTYFYCIDNTAFESVKVSSVAKNDYGFNVVTGSISSTALPGTVTNSVLNYDMFLTNTAFTLSWKPKASGANSYAKVYQLTTASNAENELSLIETNGEHWLTNRYQTGTLSTSYDDYKNSYNDLNAALSAESFFSNNGLYLFFVYDDAGNAFYYLIMIDDSTSEILQGHYDDPIAKTGWTDTYDKVNNPANYVKESTTLIFGSHKSIELTDIETNFDITIVDESYLLAYNTITGSSEITDKTSKFSFNFLENALSKTSYYGYASSTAYKIGTARNTGFNHFINIKINEITYKYEKTDPNTLVTTNFGPAKMDPLTNWETTIYADNPQSDFTGEAYYVFTVTPANQVKEIPNVKRTRAIEMNFDAVEGTFYAYGNAEGDSTQRYIRKNSATNLNTLMFTYLNSSSASNSLDTMYGVGKLTYTYYEFQYSNTSPTSYPFKANPTISNESLLEYKVLSEDGRHYIIDGINLESTGTDTLTRPGKYILKRTYVGGGYINAQGDTDGSGCGPYKKVDNNGTITYELVDFGYDTWERSYVVYVDRNGIISTTYMDDTGFNELREVGENISVQLSTGYDDEWTFKNFFRTTSDDIILTTNKLPVKVNIPLSKYFFDKDLYSALNFAKLSITISYKNSANIYAPTMLYTIDGYDADNKYCTCSALKSLTNPRGDLIFSGEGTYTITIHDNTGYTDTEVDGSVNPTYITFKFTIQHKAPNGEITVNDSLLQNYDEMFDEYATNVSKAEGNYVKFEWNDPDDPYSAKVKTITVVAKDFTSKKVLGTERIDLSAYSKPELVNVNPYYPADYTYIKDFKADHTPYTVEVFDRINYYKYDYYIKLDIENEIIYEITISYITPNTTSHGYGTFVNKKYTLIIDRTKPNENIDKLIDSETYLISSGYYADKTAIKNNFKEENITLVSDTLPQNIPTIYDYTFAANSKYVLGYNSSTRDTLTYFYFRNYKKYDGENISLTPDNKYYNDMSKFTNYPRFNPNYLVVGSNVWYKANYNLGSSALKDIIAQTYTDYGIPTSSDIITGFYEIIERDLAGNYRTFTVYFGDGTESHSLIEVEGTHLNGITHSATDKAEITANLNFSATALKAKLGWGSLSLTYSTYSNGVENVTTLLTQKLTPYDTYSVTSQRLREINNRLVTSENKRFSLRLAPYNLNAAASSKHINIIVTATRLAEPEIIKVVVTNDDKTTTTTYTLKFPEKTNSTPIFLEYLEVVDLVTGQVKLLCENLESMKYELKGLSAGTYDVTYKDNYNGSYKYKYTVYPGMNYVSESEHLQYEFNEHSVIGDKIYSGGTVTVVYESKIYNVWISRNGSAEVEVTTDTKYGYNAVDYGEFKKFTLKTTYTLSGIDANLSVGGITEYTVRYVDKNSGNTVKTENFVIYNELPGISLKDEYNNPIFATETQSISSMTTSALKVSWDSLLNYPHSSLNGVIATLYKKAENSNSYTNPIILNNGQQVSEEGYYRLVLSNAILNNTRIVYFAITEGELPFYSVVIDNKEETILNASPLSINLINEKDSNNLTLKKSFETAIANSTELDETTKVFLTEKLSSTIQTANIEHYFSIYDSKVVTNSSMNLEIFEMYYLNNIYRAAKPNSDDSYVTTFYYIYGLNDPIYANIVAVTKVPNVNSLSINNNIITRLEYENTEVDPYKKEELYSPTKTGYTKVLTNSTTSNNQITIFWNTTAGNSTDWYNKGNYVLLNYTYNKNTSNNRVYGTILGDGTSTQVLTGSGLHNLKFYDLAGNQFKFKSTYYTFDSYDLYLIDQVIFDVNNDTKNIQYATYNDAVTIKINDFFSTYYTETSIKVTRNGSLSNAYTVDENDVYTFTASGKYVVTFSGTAKVDGVVYTLDSSSYNFTIVEPTSARLAYEFSEMTGYEIIKVTKDNIDITGKIKKQYGTDTIKTLFLSPDEENFGNGFYKITMSVKYNELLDPEVFTFGVTINNEIPVITSDPLPGGTTKGTITITYNPYLIYNQLGKSKIVVLTYNSDTNYFYEMASQEITEENSAGKNVATITLNQTNSYYIQILTDSGNVVLSFRVNRAEPLNAMAIIIIVVVAVTVVILTIIFIKMRTKMKVK